MIVRDFDRLITYSSTVQYSCTAVRYSTSDTVQHRSTEYSRQYSTEHSTVVLQLYGTCQVPYSCRAIVGCRILQYSSTAVEVQAESTAVQ